MDAEGSPLARRGEGQRVDQVDLSGGPDEGRGQAGLSSEGQPGSPASTVGRESGSRVLLRNRGGAEASASAPSVVGNRPQI